MLNKAEKKMAFNGRVCLPSAFNANRKKEISTMQNFIFRQARPTVNRVKAKNIEKQGFCQQARKIKKSK